MEIWPKAISLFMLPPAILVIIAAIGLIASLRWRLYGMLTVAVCLFLIYLLSIPLTSKRLIAGVETVYPAINPELLTTEGRKPKAIVILGGGRYDNAPEYFSATVNDETLARLRYGARLHKATQLPILVSGGLSTDDVVSEADLMQKTLQEDFGVSAQWVEDDSSNTMENALRTSEILLPKNLNQVYLVTHASHMPRAVWAFTQTGMLVTPAPTEFTTLSAHPDLRTLEYLPSAEGLVISSLAIRERLGLLWYQFRYSPVKLAEMSRSPKKQREIAAEKAARAADMQKQAPSQIRQKPNPVRIKPTTPVSPPPKAPAPPLPPG